MLNSGKLAKQRVCALDEYIHKHNSLAVKGKNKPQKVNAIMDHLRSFAESTNKQTKLPQCSSSLRPWTKVFTCGKRIIGYNFGVDDGAESKFGTHK